MSDDTPILQPLADWRDPAAYDYTRALTRDGWAWEFLRRNPLYRAAWNEILRVNSPITVIPPRTAASFGVIAFENPQRTALDSGILWQPDNSPSVLQLRTDWGRATPAVETVNLDDLRERAAVIESAGTVHHLLFREDGRRLQLAIHCRALRGRISLLAEAPLGLAASKQHLSLMTRLADFLANGQLAARLYPPEARGRRLAVVLRALDAWLAKSPQRAIGRTVFDSDDIDHDWRDCDCPLRDRVRLTLRRGRWLLAGGYQTLLR
jgi:hypothetical protein